MLSFHLSMSLRLIIVALIALSTVVLPGLVHTQVLAQPTGIDLSTEYSSGDVQVFPSLEAWYTWISINGTHTIFLALHSFQEPSPVSAFVGESYNTSTGSRVFVANALMAMEVYNDSDRNGILDANYATGQTELMYIIAMNASQTFTTTPVQKTVTEGVPHYTWGVTYGLVQGGLVRADPAYDYGYGGGLFGSNVLIDHLSMFYDYSVNGNTTYLKTSYEIGNVTLVPPTNIPNLTLNGLSLSLLHFVLAVSSSPYTITANSSPYDSQNSQTSSQVNTALVNIGNSVAYEFRFKDNYTLQTNPPVSYPAVYAAASRNSLPTNAFQGTNALEIIRAQDYVKSSLPSIAGLPSSSDLSYTTSKLIYRICYPTWSGIGIKHDPTYVAYFVPHLLPVSTPVPFPISIIVYIGLAAATAAIIITFIVIKTRKPRMTETLKTN